MSLLRIFAISTGVLAICACAGAQKPSDRPSPEQMSPGLLLSCGIKEVQIDGTDAILTANADATLDTETIVTAPDRRARDQARVDLRKIYGDPKPDPRTTYRPWHYGLMQRTDLCGRPIEPSPMPSAS